MGEVCEYWSFKFPVCGQLQGGLTTVQVANLGLSVFISKIGTVVILVPSNCCEG